MSLYLFGGIVMKEIKYIKVNDLISERNYPFTKGQIRQFLLDRKRNGLYKAIRKIGKCLYVRIDLFDEWIESFKEEN